MRTHTVKLGEVAVVKGGKRLPKGVGLITTPNSHPYIRVRDLNGKCPLELNNTFEFVDDNTQATISKYTVNSGDIVLSIVGTIGLVSIVGSSLNRANLTENCVKLTALPNIDRDFLYYFLKSPYGQQKIAQGTVGAVQAKLPIKNIQNIEINLPDIKIQKEIASILSSLDNKIFVNDNINDNLLEQASSIYQAWFEDFILSDGSYPPSWEQGTLAGIADITSGKRPPVKSAEKTDTAIIPIVGAASVMGYTTKANHTDKILVIGRVGTHGVVQRFNSPCWTSDNTLIITSTFYEYTFQILQRIDYRAMNRGSTQPLITQGDMNKVPILIPDKETLSKFETLVGQLMEQYRANLLENDKLAELRDALLPKLMSGEIDVSSVQL